MKNNLKPIEIANTVQEYGESLLNIVSDEKSLEVLSSGLESFSKFPVASEIIEVLKAKSEFDNMMMEWKVWSFFKAIKEGKNELKVNKSIQRFNFDARYANKFNAKTLLYLSRYDSKEKASIQGRLVVDFMAQSIDINRLVHMYELIDNVMLSDVEVMAKYIRHFKEENKTHDLIKEIGDKIDVVSFLQRMRGAGMLYEHLDKTWEHIADFEYSWFSVTQTGNSIVEHYNRIDKD